MATLSNDDPDRALREQRLNRAAVLAACRRWQALQRAEAALVIRGLDPGRGR